MAKAKNVFEFASNNPAGATVIIGILVERLGGKVEITDADFDRFEGLDVTDLVGFVENGPDDKVNVTLTFMPIS